MTTTYVQLVVDRDVARQLESRKRLRRGHDYRWVAEIGHDFYEKTVIAPCRTHGQHEWARCLLFELHWEHRPLQRNETELVT
jgi:hypothetical protein